MSTEKVYVCFTYRTMACVCGAEYISAVPEDSVFYLRGSEKAYSASVRKFEKIKCKVCRKHVPELVD